MSTWHMCSTVGRLTNIMDGLMQFQLCKKKTERLWLLICCFVSSCPWTHCKLVCCRLFLHAIRWRKKCFVIVYWSNLSEKIDRLDWMFVKMIGFEPSRIYQNLFLAFISLKLFSQNSLKSLKSTATLLLPSPSPSPAICWHFSFLG